LAFYNFLAINVIDDHTHDIVHKKSCF